MPPTTDKQRDDNLTEALLAVLRVAVQRNERRLVRDLLRVSFLYSEYALRGDARPQWVLTALRDQMENAHVALVAGADERAADWADRDRALALVEDLDDGIDALLELIEAGQEGEEAATLERVGSLAAQLRDSTRGDRGDRQPGERRQEPRT